MGTFLGHLLPGSLFIAYGLWVLYNVFTRYFVSHRAMAAREDRGRFNSYKNSCTFLFPGCGKIPLEGFIKFALTFVASIGELVTGFRGGVFVNYGNAQHMTMYFFFGMSGVFDILVFYGLKIPPNMDYITLILAFAIEALLFGYHLHGRTPMDVQVHMFVLYVIMFCAVSTTLEMLYKKKVIPALMRAYFILLQGTWFIQVGFILYLPLTTPWDQSGPRHMMLITLIFCWHNAGVFLIMALCGWVLHHRVKKLPMASLYYELRTRVDREDNHLHKMNPEEVQGIIEDSEEEVY